MKSRHKVLSVFVVAAGLFLVVGMSSNEWKGRMDDFMHGKMDQSAESRLATWHGGWRLALDYPLTGGGFDAYPDGNLMVRYIPGSRLDTAFKGPHSIYLQMLGEQGFVGLGLFLALLISCFAALRKIRRAARRYDALKWAVPYTQMFEVSLLAYTVSGATLGRAYFDFMYQIIACVIVLKILFEREYHMLGTEDASGTPEVYEESFLAGAAIA
jgi:probable O-glycosylation ligase (exosortase A-associated)